MTFPSNPNCDRMYAAMREAHSAGRQGRTAAQWSEEFGVSINSVYRAVQKMRLKGLLVPGMVPVAKKSTLVKVCRERRAFGRIAPMAIVPATLMRGAGMEESLRVRMRVVEPGKILVEAVPSPQSPEKKAS